MNDAKLANQMLDADLVAVNGKVNGWHSHNTLDTPLWYACTTDKTSRTTDAERAEIARHLIAKGASIAVVFVSTGTATTLLSERYMTPFTAPHAVLAEAFYVQTVLKPHKEVMELLTRKMGRFKSPIFTAEYIKRLQDLGKAFFEIQSGRTPIINADTLKIFTKNSLGLEAPPEPKPNQDVIDLLQEQAQLKIGRPLLFSSVAAQAVSSRAAVMTPVSVLATAAAASALTAVPVAPIMPVAPDVASTAAVELSPRSTTTLGDSGLASNETVVVSATAIDMENDADSKKCVIGGFEQL